MRRVVSLLLAFALLIPPLPAQQPSDEAPLPVIRATTHAVLLDVVVTDKQGSPIADLKPEEIVVKENGKPQKLTSFRLERIGGEPKPLPEGLYSNRPEYVAPPGPVTIVLLDALNTTVQNQQNARQALLSYLSSQFQPGLRMAVYGLTNKLLRLQGFTTDYQQLYQSIKAYRPSSPATSPSTAESLGAATLHIPEGRASAGGSMVAVQNFIGENTPVVLESRIATTLAAMREIARVTGGMSGRKNLIWISAGFPVAFSPDEGTTITSGMIERANCPTCPPPLANEAHVQADSNVVERFKDEIRKTSAAMSASQISIYPVDARGLVNYDGGQATTRGGLLNTAAMSGDSVAGVANTQDAMKELALQTGGKAYYNRNDIDKAVALASADGGAYYALSYTSTNKKFDGAYRSLKVEVSRPNVQVRHRAGYFAYDATAPAKGKGKSKTGELSIADVMADSSLVLFDGQVAPKEAGKAIAMFRIEPKSVSWGDSSKHDLDMDVYVLALDGSGKIVTNNGITVSQSLSEEQFAQAAEKGLFVPFDLALNKGDYTMKLAVRDNRTGMIGSLTIPFSMP
jgi:VWFA-related protein